MPLDGSTFQQKTRQQGPKKELDPRLTILMVLAIGASFWAGIYWVITWYLLP